jgi:hypothetical protein
MHLSFTVNLPVLSIFVGASLARFLAPGHIAPSCVMHADPANIRYATQVEICPEETLVLLQMRVKVGGI